MNKLGFLLLAVLEEHEAFGRISAMTLRDIMDAESFGCDKSTVFKKLKYFEEKMYVCKGMKEGKADTFYITAAGRDLLRTERGRQKGEENEK